MDILDIFIEYRLALLKGLLVTLKLCLIIWSGGIVFGILLGTASIHFRKSVGIIFQTLSFFLSGVPILIFLYWMHYPLQTLLNVVVDPFYTAALTLTIINVFIVASLMREILLDFPNEYIIAARVCGLPEWAIFYRIQMPIISRRLLPGLLSSQVIMLQSTIFASLISVEEIFRVTQQINSQIHRPVEIYTTIGVMFLAICLPLNAASMYLRHRFTRNFSEQ